MARDTAPTLPLPHHPRHGLRRMMPAGLLSRSLLIIVVPLFLVQAVTATVFYANHWERVTRRLANGLAGDVAMVSAFWSAHDTPVDRAWIADAAHSHLQLQLDHVPRAVLDAHAPQPSPNEAAAATLALALDGALGRPYRIDADSDPDYVVIAVQVADGLLELRADRKRLFGSTTYLVVAWGVGTSLLLFGIATVFMRNQVRPIRRLAAAADRFGKGRDVSRFKPEGATEVRQAGQAFLRMRERIQRQIDQRTEMLAGVSHDLRTPLTRLKLGLAMLGEANGPVAPDDLADLEGDLSEMERMLEGYLAFARGEGREPITETNLGALLEDVVDRFRRSHPSIDLHAEEDTAVPVRPHLLERCLSNLIGNAVRHGTHVAVRLGCRADGVEIVVDDDGPGIPADKREAVFGAFVRLEPSRNPATGGIGLGLTIARDGVRGMGGDVILEDSPLGGLRVRLSLPL